MALVIVESPTKAKTISKFIGKKYQVESSFGHVRDLPRGKLGIDTENNFEPHYVIPRKIQTRVTALRKIAAKADIIILATDEDREGEAIAWHLTKALKLDDQDKKIERIVFHEITKEAIQQALKNPREILTSLVDAQQARRILDRLVGYKLSPFLWKKIARGLSAGRVQSIALWFICEREKEIKKFKSEEYWTIEAMVFPERKIENKFTASLSQINGESIPKLGVKSKSEAQKITKKLEKSEFKVLSVTKSESRRNPLPPFITSTLQQTASRHLGFSAKKTMFLAQSLYENGHITYMRTDSFNLSRESLINAQGWIGENLGLNYATGPKTFKAKSKLAQEAHEAIRPTEPARMPSNDKGEKAPKLSADEGKLYDLIWRRFIASQLPPAIIDNTKIEIEARQATAKEHCLLNSNGNIIKFDGFLKIWKVKTEEKILPEVKEGEILALDEIQPTQHFTEPPPRYNEASLIKTLEKFGIGRPSTYAPTISVIQERNYVEKIQGRFQPTEIGSLVNRVLEENFSDIVNVEFTAKMEGDLDKIANGEIGWQETVKEFYEPFDKNLERKYEEVSKQELTEEKTGEICELCGKEMIIKFGRFGKFMACSGYPECKNTKTLKEPPKKIGLKCPKCGKGDVIEKRVNKKGRARGKIFWGCDQYPDCDYASWTNPLQKKEDSESDKRSNSEE